MRRLVLTLAVLALSAVTTEKMLAQEMPLCSTGCLGARAVLDYNEFTAVSRPPESGPFTYTIRLRNNGDEEAFVEPVCQSPSQVPCSLSAESFYIPVNDTVSFTVTYFTMGAGSFRHSVYWSYSGGGAFLRLNSQRGPEGSLRSAFRIFRAPVSRVREGTTIGLDSVVQAPVTVGPPMQVHYRPYNGQPLATSDSIIVRFEIPGLNVASLKVGLDGNWTVSQSTADGGCLGSPPYVCTGYAYTSTAGLTAGSHTLSSYGCTTGGRCDSLTTTFSIVGSEVFAGYSIDDSLPVAAGIGIVTFIPGALPLPPAYLRGCPVVADAPDILLTAPYSYGNQGGATSGIIFRPAIGYGSYININALTIDNQPTDTRTCGSIPFLDQDEFDWDWWAPGDPEDPLRDSYPYSDGPLLDPPGGGGNLVASPNATFRDVASRLAGRIQSWLDRIGAPAQEARRRRLAQQLDRFASRLNRRRPPRPRDDDSSLAPTDPIITNLGDPGAIDTSSYVVILNGDTIVAGGQPRPGVELLGLSRIGSQYRISVLDARVNRYHPDYPTNPDSSPNGGWNELIASIADSSGNRTAVRARFVVPKGNRLVPVGLTALRDFRRHSEGDCAAFGAFQCGGVTIAQTLPGFVSRDRARALHLVYRSSSAGGPIVLPMRINVDRFAAPPDSLELWTTRNGVTDSVVTRYAGRRGPADLATLYDNATQERIVGAIVSRSQGLDTALFQRVQVTARGYMFSGGPLDTTITQDVVRRRWTDTALTRFGVGWNLAEVARLAVFAPPDSVRRAIYLAGDGSHAVFRDSAGVWLPPPGITNRLADTTFTGGDSVIRQVLYLNNGGSVGFDAYGRQRWTQDLLGNKTTFVYHSNPGSTRLLSIRDPNGYWFTFTYSNARVQRIAVRDPAAVSRTLDSLIYDASGRLAKLIQFTDSGRADTTQFRYRTYSPYALLDTIIDPRGTVATITYDSVYGTPTGATRPAANPGLGGPGAAAFRDTWRRSAPRIGRGTRAYGAAATQPLERMLYPNQVRGTYFPFAGRPMDYLVDAFGAPTYVRPVPTEPTLTPDFLLTVYPNQPVRWITRDSASRVLKIVSRPDSLSGATLTGEAVDSVMYRYNALGEVDRIIRPARQYPSVNAMDTTTFTYDQIATGRLSARCTRLLSMTDPFGATTITGYPTSGTVARCLPTQIIGPLADTTRFTYGTLNAGASYKWTTRPIRITDPRGRVDTIAYGGTFWNAIRTARSDGATTLMFHDWLGHTDSVRLADGTPAVSRHDWLGRVVLQRTGTGLRAPVTRTHYMRGGLVDSVIVYASSGEIEVPADTNIQITRYHYNALGWRDTSYTSGGRRQISRLYDGFGNPIWNNPGNGSLITRIHDGDGRLVQEALSPTWPGFSHDGLAFASPYVDSVYRSLGMIQNRTLSGARGSRRSYDVNGRLATMDDSVVVHRYGYSRQNALVADTLDFAGGLRVARFYTYNRRGQRESVSDTTWKSGARIGYGRINYGYDTYGRLDTMVAWRDSASVLVRVGWTRWLYDRFGADTLRTMVLGASGGDTLRVRTAYDTFGRTTATASVTAVNGLTQHSYTPGYDVMDRVTSFSGTERPESGPVSVTGSYTYDSLGTGRLLSSSRWENSTLSGQTWLYDVLGNRQRESRVDGCSGIDTMRYGADNQLLYRRRNCSSFSGTAFLNDNMGNRLVTLDTANGFYQGPSSLMSYTAKGQLFFAMTPTASANNYQYTWHLYDGSGLRVASHSTLGSSWTPNTDLNETGPRTYYVYDGSDVALTVYCSNSTCNVHQRFMTGGVDEPLGGYFRGATGSYRPLMFVSDHQGSTRLALRRDGTRETSASYWARDPFGAMLGPSGTGGDVNTETGYTGASSPNQTGGFTYLRNRWYDPSTGRFLTQDPIGLAGGINLYAYAGNNPVTFSDPFGLKECPPCDREKPTWSERWIANISAWWERTKQRAVEVGTQIAAAFSPADELVLASTGLDVTNPTAGQAGAGTRALAVLGAGATIAGAAADFGPVAGRLVGAGGALRTSRTVASQLEGQRGYIPSLAILETVASGTRVADPQGAAGRFMYTSAVEWTIGGRTSRGTLEVLVNEAASVIEHVMYRSR